MKKIISFLIVLFIVIISAKPALADLDETVYLAVAENHPNVFFSDKDGNYTICSASDLIGNDTVPIEVTVLNMQNPFQIELVIFGVGFNQTQAFPDTTFPFSQIYFITAADLQQVIIISVFFRDTREYTSNDLHQRDARLYYEIDNDPPTFIDRTIINNADNPDLGLAAFIIGGPLLLVAGLIFIYRRRRKVN